MPARPAAQKVPGTTTAGRQLAASPRGAGNVTGGITPLAAGHRTAGRAQPVASMCRESQDKADGQAGTGGLPRSCDSMPRSGRRWIVAAAYPLFSFHVFLECALLVGEARAKRPPTDGAQHALGAGGAEARVRRGPRAGPA
jgi:hypothetical protein